MRVTDRILASLGASLVALVLVGCSREPRNDFLVKFECEFTGLEGPMPVTVDLERLRLSIQTSADSSVSVPLRSIDGQLVFENDPRNDQSLKLWMRSDGRARVRAKVAPGTEATELSGTCEKTN
jgi:hypothetical protein